MKAIGGALILGTLEPSLLSQWSPSFGQALSSLWLVYGLGLFLSTFLGLNFALLLLFAHLARQPQAPPTWLRRSILPFEILFCLVHPLAYLLIFVRTSSDRELFADVQSSALDPLAWFLLLVLWFLRIAPGSRTAQLRRWIQPLLGIAIGTLLLFAVKDFVPFFSNPSSEWWRMSANLDLFGLTFFLGLASLYLIPLVVLLRFLDCSRSPERWENDSGFRILPGPVGITLSALLLAVAGSSFGLLQLRPSSIEAKEIVLSHRGEILSAAADTGTDPQLLAALVHVVQNRQKSALGEALETTLLETWLHSSKNGLMLSDTINPSVGLAQIKPLTAQQALNILEDHLRPEGMRFYYPESRGRFAVGKAWQGQAFDLRDLEQGPEWFRSRRDMAERLLSDQAALDMAAVILELYARQWESANPDWSIRHRPAILATLYQLGFERSHPKAQPKSNAFGDAVERIIEQRWIKEAFPNHEPTPAL